ncbi:MAG: ABC-type transporter, integral rane subunit [Frankiales bacterium]|nr:ABC-type transporter, integral rane subunit [Frankiales bacterium]
MLLTLQLALAGLAFGSVAALSGIGLVVTYRATGVFNLAHGAVATFIAYVHWELVARQGVPEVVAAPLCVLVLAPVLGVLGYRAVFRPLQQRDATPAEALVTTLGLFVLVVGLTTVLWGNSAKRAPSVFATARWDVGDLTIRSDTVVQLGVVGLVAIVLAVLTGPTRLGADVRAVVDRRELALLSGVDVDRVNELGWAIGTTLSAITGLLLAPGLSLTPYGLTLVVLETFAIPVLARLSSLGVATVAGLALGVAQAELSQVHVTAEPFATALQGLQSNLLVVALLGGLLLLPSLREVGDAGTARSFSSRHVRRTSLRRSALLYGTAVVLLASPLTYPAEQLRQAQAVPGLAVVLVSIVVLTGYGGRISLGQAGFAGLGALFFAKLSTGAPELIALVGGMLAAGAIGVLTGYPAIRRRGLFLALTTFAVGVTVSRFVFESPSLTAGVDVNRPSLFGLSLAGDHTFYAFELVCLVVALLVVRNLRSGPLGRALVAARDSEDGARASGLDIGRLTLFTFTISSVMAGLGGALLAQTALAFESRAFDPVSSSLVWFTAVVVFGADSAAGAVLASGLFVAMELLTGTSDAALLPIGLLAVLLGRFPGGVLNGLVALRRTAPAPVVVRQLSPTGKALVARR